MRIIQQIRGIYEGHSINKRNSLIRDIQQIRESFYEGYSINKENSSMRVIQEIWGILL